LHYKDTADSSPQPATKPALETTDEHDDIVTFTEAKLTRNSLYLDTLAEMNVSVRIHRVFLLHLYMLESLSIGVRSSLMIAVAANEKLVNDIDKQAEPLRNAVQQFKRLLAARLCLFNRTPMHDLYEDLRGNSRHSHEVLRRICDIFDEPLFYVAYYFVTTQCDQQVTHLLIWLLR
jgi:hypothetical protein